MDVAGMWRGCGLDVAVLTPIYRFHLEPIYPLNKGCESQCKLRLIPQVCGTVSIKGEVVKAVKVGDLLLTKVDLHGGVNK